MIRAELLTTRRSRVAGSDHRRRSPLLVRVVFWLRSTLAPDLVHFFAGPSRGGRAH